MKLQNKNYKSSKVMKTLCFIFICAYLSLGNALAQDSVELTEKLNFDFSNRRIIVSNSAKSTRASKRGGGKIIINFVDSIYSKELITSINVAKDIWDYYIPAGDTLRIDVHFESDLDCDIEAGVRYILDSEKNIYYPSCLFRKINAPFFENENYDARIHINTSTNWSIGIGEENSPVQKNLTVAFMQCICKCLGFQTSLRVTNRGVEFKYKTKVSIFDSFIENSDGDKLTSYISNRNALQQFVKGQLGDVYFVNNNTDARLYSPSVFDEYYSLNFTYGENSLMDYDAELHSCDLLVDDLTLDILNALGWNFKSSDSSMSIKSNDIDDTGIASAYSSHSFYIHPYQDNISMCSWKLILPSTNGTPVTSVESNNHTFIIPPISTPDAYEHNVEGDIHGCITFDGVVDGETVHLTYPIILELAPRIISASVISTTLNPENTNYYDADVEIVYEGSNYVHAYVEEEYNPFLTSYYSSTPYYTKIHLTDVAAWCEAWLDITIRNDYGSDSMSLDLSCPMTLTSPDRPVIQDFELQYDDYDFSQHEFVNLRFSCKVAIPHADEIFMDGTDFGNSHIMKDIFFSFGKFLKLSPVSNVFVIKEEDCDIFQWIRFKGFNRHGWSENSDTVFINDYIKDPKILQDLEKLTQMQTPTVDVNDILSWGQGYVSINSASCDRIQFFNPQGVLIREAIRPQVGNRFELKKGIFVVKVFCKEKCYTKNIII